ncbi:alpha/beta hydrolase [Buttiauxella selenatireducens]|uniref:Alpha/beta hydrolase n=1 Tax=Buttiauxella selenatireducens TaxID=3073902 RepID=A0ABY9S4H3_9ENTR|nr:alpha/beta hydrolase [Buttiauxella sp. R73]WMY72249.1 alpha/beta hydrolase [Buttiauxella sp. R73]
METFFSETAHSRVRWLDLPGTGAPLVFVHGIGCASSYEYPRVVTDKNFADRRAILIDLLGFGYSEKPKDFGYSIKEQAQVVAELIAHLNLEKYFLYGHSMGGSICIEASQFLGEGLCGLIVSEPNFHPGGGFFSRQICSFSEADYLSTTHHAMVNAESGPWAGSLAIAAPWAVWRGADSLIKGNNWLDIFARLGRPKALVFGEQSLPNTDFTQVQNLGIQTTVLPDCGHSMSWENPSALAHALDSFCKKHEEKV